MLKIQINGKMFYSFWKRKELYALSFFCCISFHYSHKKFSKKDFPVIAEKLLKSEGVVARLTKKCVDLGLVSYENGIYTLTTNKKIHEIHGGKYLFSAHLPKEIIEKGLQTAYDFLRSIPILSNIRAQEFKIEKKKDMTYKRACSQKNCYMPVKDVKAVKLWEKNRFSFDYNETTTLSNKTGSKIAGVSKPTFIKLKRFLHATKTCSVNRRSTTHVENVSFTEFSEMREFFTDFGIPAYAKYCFSHRCIYSDLASNIVLLKKSTHA